MRSGDVGRFNRELATFLDVFMRRGTYLVLEKAKALVYRTLLKQVGHGLGQGGALGGGRQSSAAATSGRPELGRVRARPRQVYRLDEEKKPSQLRLERVGVALALCGEPMSMDQIECLCAGLIFNGHVKGYIAHAQKVLVLHRTAPFPIDSFRDA